MTTMNIRPACSALLRAKTAFDGCPDTLCATVESLLDALFSSSLKSHQQRGLVHMKCSSSLPMELVMSRANRASHF